MMRYLGFVSLLLLVTACSDIKQKEEAKSAFPESIGVAQCESCGMVVRDQPAPRGQAVHRDGTRRFFCSIGDMLIYMETPSPHGRVTHAFVEALGSDHDPEVLDNSEQPWIPIHQAAYVTGIPRSGIMGEPVLVYDTMETARLGAQNHGGNALDWNQLQEQARKGW